MNTKCIRQALKVTTPVFFGYISIGIPFGLMLVQAGYPWWMSLVMSVSMYAGAGQYMAIGLFATGASIPSILIAELLINIRHIVYGLSLITQFKACGKWRPFLIFGLTDETYALMTSTEVPEGADQGTFYGTICLADYLYWVSGSVIGALAGNFIPAQYLTGVDFALTALFIVLLIEQIKKSRDIVPPAVGITVTLIVVVLSRLGLFPSQNILIVALTFGIAALMLVKHRNLKECVECEKEEKK